MKISYDAEVDALSITFRDTTVTTKHLAEGIAADYDSEGRLAGLEILDAQKRFGGTIGDRGDAGDAIGWLCLDGSNKNGPWILWLISGEINGPTIGGFQWRRLSPGETPDRRCSRIPDDKGGIELPIALHFGMTEAEVQKLLGRPTVTRSKTFFFSHEHEAVIDKEKYTVSNDVAVVFRGGRLWEIEVVKTTSN